MMPHRVQFGTRRSVVRTQALDHAPEACRVVHLLQVRELVRHHVVHDVRRSLHEPPAEAHLALRIAAAPASQRIGDENAWRLEPQLSAVVRDADAKVGLGEAPGPLHSGGAHPVGGVRLGKRQCEDVAILQLSHRIVVRDQEQPQLAAQVVDQLAVLPQTRLWLA
jgi:hypothetical protein